jgi:glycosyltransferase involved in cell wall biosynthesis
MLPTATVLLPVHNDRRFVDEALDSVLSQDRSNVEVLVIDDASSDGTLDIVRQFQSRHDNVVVVRNDSNYGLGYTLARGVVLARGRYVIRMDADDVCMEARFERQIGFLDANPDIDIVGGAAIEIDERGTPGRVRRMPTDHEAIARAIQFCPLIHPTVAFRRDRVIAAGNYRSDLRRRQDYELWFRCLHQGLRFANLPEPLIRYRFSEHTHQKQSLSRALEQARIGWHGCRMLELPWWQRMSVLAPLIRSVLPSRIQHLAYAAMAAIDPRYE